MAQPVIIQGEDRSLNISIVDSVENVAFDLTGATEISVSLPSTISGPATSFTLTASEIAVTDALKGRFTLTISDTKCALLKVGEQTMEIVIDKGAAPGGTRRIIQIEKSVKIVKKLY